MKYNFSLWEYTLSTFYEYNGLISVPFTEDEIPFQTTFGDTDKNPLHKASLKIDAYLERLTIKRELKAKYPNDPWTYFGLDEADWEEARPTFTQDPKLNWKGITQEIDEGSKKRLRELVKLAHEAITAYEANLSTPDTTAKLAPKTSETGPPRPELDSQEDLPAPITGPATGPATPTVFNFPTEPGYLADPKQYNRFRELLLELALALLTAGFNVLPIGWRKHPPFTGFERHYKDPMTAREMRKAFELLPYLSGLGLVLGATSKNLWALDFDNQEIIAWAEDLVKKGIIPAPLLKEITPGGQHWFYEAPEGTVFPNKSKVNINGHEIEVFSQGHIVIAPSYTIPKDIEKTLSEPNNYTDFYLAMKSALSRYHVYNGQEAPGVINFAWLENQTKFALNDFFKAIEPFKTNKKTERQVKTAQVKTAQAPTAPVPIELLKDREFPIPEGKRNEELLDMVRKIQNKANSQGFEYTKDDIFNHFWDNNGYYFAPPFTRAELWKEVNKTVESAHKFVKHNPLTDNSGIVWSEPEPLLALPVPRLDLTKFPLKIRDHIDSIAQALQVPIEMIIPSFLGMLSRANLGIYIIIPTILDKQGEPFRFTEETFHPQIYSICIAASGTRKTGVLKFFTQVMSKIEEELRHANDTKNEKNHNQLEMKKKELKQLDKLIDDNFKASISRELKEEAEALEAEEAEPEELETEEASEDLPESTIEEPDHEPPKQIPTKGELLAKKRETIQAEINALAPTEAPVLNVTNATMEALGKTWSLQKNQCLASIADEGRIIEIMLGLYSGTVDDFMLLGPFNGGPIDSLRIGTGNYFMPMADFSLTAYTQPVNFESVITSPKLQHGGLIARTLLFLVPPFPLPSTLDQDGNFNITIIDRRTKTDVHRRLKELFKVPIANGDKALSPDEAFYERYATTKPPFFPYYKNKEYPIYADEETSGLKETGRFSDIIKAHASKTENPILISIASRIIEISLKVAFQIHSYEIERIEDLPRSTIPKACLKAGEEVARYNYEVAKYYFMGESEEIKPAEKLLAHILKKELESITLTAIKYLFRSEKRGQTLIEATPKALLAATTLVQKGYLVPIDDLGKPTSKVPTRYKVNPKIFLAKKLNS
ncbi:MAG: DUF3987 domain-containing protein [Deltaproteobacteria bacterium]|jgi:hypothetical protein|nr:DUF3987 domain-containing protein [Deltaproteobacteria bacterium]